MSTKKVYVGMDVHKDSVMAAVLAEDGAAPTVVKRLPNEERKLKRFLDRRGRDGTVRCCYEASGAGYVLERAIRSWRHGCEIVAPSLIPQRPGERRKHDRKDAKGGGHKPHRDRKNMRHIPRHGPRDGTCGYRGGSEVLVNVRGWSMLPR